MKVKKAGKRVFGAVMSAAEKKAMNMEIQRQLAEYDRKHIREIDALVLWELREQLVPSATSDLKNSMTTSPAVSRL